MGFDIQINCNKVETNAFNTTSVLKSPNSKESDQKSIFIKNPSPNKMLVAMAESAKKHPLSSVHEMISKGNTSTEFNDIIKNHLPVALKYILFSKQDLTGDIDKDLQASGLTSFYMAKDCIYSAYDFQMSLGHNIDNIISPVDNFYTMVKHYQDNLSVNELKALHTISRKLTAYLATLEHMINELDSSIVWPTNSTKNIYEIKNDSNKSYRQIAIVLKIAISGASVHSNQQRILLGQYIRRRTATK